MQKTSPYARTAPVGEKVSPTASNVPVREEEDGTSPDGKHPNRNGLDGLASNRTRTEGVVRRLRPYAFGISERIFLLAVYVFYLGTAAGLLLA